VGRFHSPLDLFLFRRLLQVVSVCVSRIHTRCSCARPEGGKGAPSRAPEIAGIGDRCAVVPQPGVGRDPTPGGARRRVDLANRFGSSGRTILPKNRLCGAAPPHRRFGGSSPSVMNLTSDAPGRAHENGSRPRGLEPSYCCTARVNSTCFWSYCYTFALSFVAASWDVHSPGRQGQDAFGSASPAGADYRNRPYRAR
jgi:hypothetical protein